MTTKRPFLRNIIVEGVDRLGKGTLIKGIQDTFGFFQVIHYQKPELLKTYFDQHRQLSDAESSKKSALFEYQYQSFKTMLKLLGVGADPSLGSVRFLLDRAHLGEAVYAHRYRKYTGEYVFTLEEAQIDDGNDFAESTLLVLLTTNDFSFIQDDGLSLDVNQRVAEQEDFKTAFAKSKIKHKLLIDVSDGRGGFLPASTILQRVVNAYAV